VAAMYAVLWYAVSGMPGCFCRDLADLNLGMLGTLGTLGLLPVLPCPWLLSSANHGAGEYVSTEVAC